MSAAADGQGYCLVASDGGIFAFGNAAFSTVPTRRAGTPEPAPLWPWAAAPKRPGLLVSGQRRGGIFSYGDSPYYGSLACNRGKLWRASLSTLRLPGTP